MKIKKKALDLTPRKRKHNPDLPKGLYVHRQKFRCRAWIDSEGTRHPANAPNRKIGWKMFEGPLAVAAKAFYEFRKQNHDEGEISRELDGYLNSEDFRKLAPATQCTERPRVERLKRVFGHMSIRSLTKIHVRDYLKSRSPYGGKKDMKRLSAIMTIWAADDLVASNFVIDSIKRHAPPDISRTRYVTDGELERAHDIIRRYDGYSERVIASYLELALLTGRRVSNVARIKRSDITKDGIEFHETKTNKVVIVQMTPELSAAIERAKTRCVPGFYLLTNSKGNELTYAALNRAWQKVKKYLEKEGMDLFQLRDIRAKYGTDMEDQGRDGARNLNHSSRKIFDLHYNRKPKKVESLK